MIFIFTFLLVAGEMAAALSCSGGTVSGDHVLADAVTNPIDGCTFTCLTMNITTFTTGFESARITGSSTVGFGTPRYMSIRGHDSVAAASLRTAITVNITGNTFRDVVWYVNGTFPPGSAIRYQNNVALIRMPIVMKRLFTFHIWLEAVTVFGGSQILVQKNQFEIDLTPDGAGPYAYHIGVNGNFTVNGTGTAALFDNNTLLTDTQGTTTQYNHGVELSDGGGVYLLDGGLLSVSYNTMTTAAGFRRAVFLTIYRITPFVLTDGAVFRVSGNTLDTTATASAPSCEYVYLIYVRQTLTSPLTMSGNGTWWTIDHNRVVVGANARPSVERGLVAFFEEATIANQSILSIRDNTLDFTTGTPPITTPIRLLMINDIIITSTALVEVVSNTIELYWGQVTGGGIVGSAPSTSGIIHFTYDNMLGAPPTLTVQHNAIISNEHLPNAAVSSHMRILDITYKVESVVGGVLALCPNTVNGRVVPYRRDRSERPNANAFDVALSGTGLPAVIFDCTATSSISMTATMTASLPNTISATPHSSTTATMSASPTVRVTAPTRTASDSTAATATKSAAGTSASTTLAASATTFTPAPSVTTTTANTVSSTATGTNVPSVSKTPRRSPSRTPSASLPVSNTAQETASPRIPPSSSSNGSRSCSVFVSPTTPNSASGTRSHSINVPSKSPVRTSSRTTLPLRLAVPAPTKYAAPPADPGPAGVTGTVVAVGVTGTAGTPFGSESLSSIQLLAIFAVMACQVPGAGNAGMMRRFLTPVGFDGRSGALAGNVLVAAGLTALYGAVFAVLAGVLRSQECARRLLRHPQALPLLHLLTLPGLAFEAATLLYGDAAATAGERVFGGAVLALCCASVGAYGGVSAYYHARVAPLEATVVRPRWGPAELAARVPRVVRALLVPAAGWAEAVRAGPRCVYVGLRPLAPAAHHAVAGHSALRVLIVCVVCAVRPGAEWHCTAVLSVAGVVCAAHAALLLALRPLRIPVANPLQAAQSAAVGGVAFIRAGNGPVAVSTAFTVVLVVASLLSSMANIAAFLAERRYKLFTIIAVTVDEGKEPSVIDPTVIFVRAADDGPEACANDGEMGTFVARDGGGAQQHGGGREALYEAESTNEYSEQRFVVADINALVTNRNVNSCGQWDSGEWPAEAPVGVGVAATTVAEEGDGEPAKALRVSTPSSSLFSSGISENCDGGGTCAEEADGGDLRDSASSVLRLEE